MSNRGFHFFLIDFLLLIILLIVYYYGGIENDSSMSICLLGTYIIFRSLFISIYMKFYPFKCGEYLCK